MSDFGTATLDLREKSDIKPIFPRAGSKLTEFWNRLIRLRKNISPSGWIPVFISMLAARQIEL
jgi:hypothetical protein